MGSVNYPLLPPPLCASTLSDPTSYPDPWISNTSLYCYNPDIQTNL